MNSFKRYSIIFAIIAVLLGLYFAFEFVFAPRATDATVLIRVSEGENFGMIADNLYKNGLIKFPLWLKILAKVDKRDTRIMAGDHKLPSSLSASQILEALNDGRYLKPIIITIKDGQTLKDIEARLANLGFYYDLKSVKLGDISRDFSFLKEFPQSAGLEGFFAPNTYFLKPGQSRDEFLKMALGQFESKSYVLLGDDGLTKYQQLILASMIEKEVRDFEDKRIVSGILKKRLLLGMPLQVDATLVYFKCDIFGMPDCRTGITAKDLATDSFFNTYKYKDLPPMPIANPGVDSLRAAGDPLSSKYLYYLTASDGKVIFSQTFEEHKFARQKYL